MTKKEMRIADLEEMMIELKCSCREALYEMICIFYTSVFREEDLINKLDSMTEDEVLEVYLNF